MADLQLTRRWARRGLPGLAWALAMAACQRQGPTPAREYHVSPAGDDDGDCDRATQAATPRRTLKAVLACARPGDTVTLHDGRYGDRLVQWPSGAPGRYLTIRAAREGAVILAGGLQLQRGSSYLVFKGLRLHGGQKTILGNHLRFHRNEWKGSCPATNCGTVVVGAIESAPTADVLFEDNWFHGLGGRANFKSFNASRLVVRRAIVRHDGGWAAEYDEEPVEAAVILHNSRDTLLQDVLVLDSTLRYHAWKGAFVVQKDSSSTTPTRNLRFQGLLALDSPVAGFRVLGAGLIEDLVIERSMFIGSDGGVLLGEARQAARLSDVVDRMGRQLPVEPVLAHRHGRDGTSYGQAGWDERSRIPLWPWPEQERIQRELCQEAGVSRGFCAARCLSEYVLGRLGRPTASACPGRAGAAARPEPVSVAAHADGGAPDSAPAQAVEFADWDLVAVACPTPSCLQADDDASLQVDEFGPQWGTFTLEAQVKLSPGAEGQLSLAGQAPLPDERLPVTVSLSSHGRVRLTVDVPRASYGAVLIGPDGREQVLATELPFAGSASNLSLAVVRGQRGSITVCRTALTRPECFSTAGDAGPIRFSFPSQAGPLVARAEVSFLGPRDGWLGLGGRTATGRELPRPLVLATLGTVGGHLPGKTVPIRLPLDPLDRAHVPRGREALLIDRWEAAGPAGWLTVCRPEIQVPRCLMARAQRGVRPRHQSFCPQRAPFTALARVVPAATRLDGAVALASGAVGEWNSLGPIVRFSPAGVIDVNDGPGYLPSTLPYQAGRPHLVRLVVDPVARRYDAFVTPPDGRERPLGRGLRFRNQQLQRFDAFVLPIDIGEMSACGLTVRR